MTLPEQRISTVSAMRKLVTLVDLSEDSMDKLAELATLATYAEGTVLFSEGEHQDQIYFIVNGSLRLEMSTTRCGRQTILTVGSGDILAWSAILGDGTMTSTAIVTEESQLIVINASDLKHQSEVDTDFGYEMMTVIAKALAMRLLATRLQLLDLYHT
ncbi:MAG: cyclic nucleotide-binding domain-containing protein [Pirellula sp.]